MKNESEASKTGDVPAGVMCWLIHHDTIVEMTYEPLPERELYILEHKPGWEVPIRLKWMRPVKGELPVEVVKASRAYAETWKAYLKVMGSTDPLDKEEAYNRAEVVFLKAIVDNGGVIEQLHREECPGCPWDWDQNTLFPAGPKECFVGQL